MDDTYNTRVIRPKGSLASLIPAEYHELSGMQKLNALLELDDVAARFGELTPQEALSIIKEIGISDSLELIALTTPEQLVGIFDLETWHHDRFALTAFLQWIQITMEADRDKLVELIPHLDPELVALFFKHFNVITIVDRDELGQLPTAALVTPDNRYALVPPQDFANTSLLITMISVLYEQGVDFAAAIFKAVEFSLSTQLENMCFRMRSGRLQDLGFPTRKDALETFRPLPLPHIRELIRSEAYTPSSSPRPLIKPSGLVLSKAPPSLFLFKVLALLHMQDPQDDQRTHLEEIFIYLVNHSAVARNIDYTNVDEMTEEIRWVAGLMSIGLETLANHDVVEGITLIQSAHPARLVQAGLARIDPLRRRAQVLHRQLEMSNKLRLLEPELNETILAMTQRWPLYMAIDRRRQSKTRPFFSSDDLNDTDKRLREAELVWEFFTQHLGFTVDVLRQGIKNADDLLFITLKTLFILLIIRYFTTHSWAIQPLTRREFKEFGNRIPCTGESPPRIDPVERLAILTSIEHNFASFVDDPEKQLWLKLYVESVLDSIEEELLTLPPSRRLDARFLRTGLVVEEQMP